MFRFFGEINTDGKITLDKENSHHYVNVLRIKENEDVEVATREGIFIANFDAFNEKNVVLKIKSKCDSKHESPVNLTLVQAILKSDNMEKAIKGAVEVGVKEILPLIAKRNVSDVDKKADKKIQRWQKICEVAAKQSKRDIIPTVNNPVTIEFLKDFDGEIIVCYENEDDLRFEDIQVQSNKIALIIGPEGGFEDREIEQLKSYGAKIISLGNRILRAETAAICASYHVIACLEGKK